MAGALLSIGGIVFAALVMRGSGNDIRSVLYWVRRASVILALGAVIEVAAHIATARGDWLFFWPDSTTIDAVLTAFGMAILLRLIGAALMLRAHLHVVPAERVPDPVVAMQAATGVGSGPQPPPPTEGRFAVAEPYAHPGDRAWRVDGELALVGLGIAAALLSFVFDGHTVTEGIRWMTAMVDVAHVAAAAVWAGGLVMLVHVIWLRHRRGSDTRALQLAVRFSVLAAGALVLAGIAGLGLTVIVVDQWSDLWTTTWGRVLLGKVALVGFAAAAGGYNHKVLIPHMMRHAATGEHDDSEFRRAVTIEGVVMGLIVVLTAILVGSPS
jgi:copper transport protein